MPKYRSRATLQSGRRLDINELRRSGVTTGEFRVTFPRDGAPGTLNVFMEERGGSWLRVRLPPNVDQTFTLVRVRRPFGGHQWYFICSLSLYGARSGSWRQCCRYTPRIAFGYTACFEETVHGGTNGAQRPVPIPKVGFFGVGQPTRARSMP